MDVTIEPSVVRVRRTSKKELLMSNGYPANFIDSIVHSFLSKQFSNTDVIQPYGPHKRRVYLCLPYVGELATNKFARQIRRLIAKIAPCVELRLVFRAAQKLSCLTRLKSKLNVLSRSGVVYQISCTQCEAFYVGKTKRRLEQRVQEHSQQGYSSLYKHSSDLCHQIDYSNPAVISVDNNDYRLQIKEALKIKDLKAYNSLNANIRSCGKLVFCLLTLVTWFICFIDHTLLLLYLCCLSFTMFCVQLLYVQLILFL